METRRRILDAAMAEMERVGVEEARVADIVEAAGVGWGSFYRYFPTKEDVLLEAAANVAQVLADFCQVGLEAGQRSDEIIIGAIWRAASAAPRAPSLWETTFRTLAERPERVSQILAGRRTPAPVEALAAVIDHGQRAGQLRGDQPAHLLAQVLLTAAWATALREGPVGIMTLPPPPPPPVGAAERVSQRNLVVGLIVRGLRTDRPPEGGSPPDKGGRIGRTRGPVQPDPDPEGPTTSKPAVQERSSPPPSRKRGTTRTAARR